MGIIQYLLQIISSPIIWFWKKEQEYVEKQEYGKIALSLLISILLVILMGITLLYLTSYVMQYHFNIVMILGVICWIYWVVKQVYINSNPVEENDTKFDMEELHNYAERGYPQLRTIIFSTLREISKDINGKIPHSLAEIEIPLERYYINGDTGIIYYQFRLAKDNITLDHTPAELSEFKDIIQNTFYNLWIAGKFTHIELKTQTDSHGNIHPPIYITQLEDLGNEYVMQSVFTSESYIELLHICRENQRVPKNIGYNTNDSRFL